MSNQLTKITEQHCSNPPAKYDDLKVLFLNCTLNRTPVLSHTEGLIGVAQRIFEANGVATKVIRPIDYTIPVRPGLDILKPSNRQRSPDGFVYYNLIEGSL